MKLRQIVETALDDASVKLASAADVLPDQTRHVDYGLKVAEDSCEKCGKTPCECDKKKPPMAKDDSEEEKTSGYDDVIYAMKLAQALDVALPYLQVKMAQPTSHVTAPGGMEVMEGGHNTEQTKHPRPKPATVPAMQASHGGGSDEDRNDGNKTGIETNRSDYSDPDWTKNKESALRVLEAKIAQAEQLHAQGHIKQASNLALSARAEYKAKVAEVQGASPTQTIGQEVITYPAGATQNAGKASDLESSTDAQRKADANRSEKKESGAPGAKTAGFDFANMPVKVAADPSSPQASGLSTGSDYLLSVEPPEAKNFPGNEEVASMTKRDAKTRSTRNETSPFVREPAFSAAADPSIKANLQHWLGSEKISSIQGGAARALLKKIAATEDDPEASDEDKEKAKKVREAIEAKKEAALAGV